MFDLQVIPNIHILIVGLAASANIILGVIVFLQNKKNVTGRIFLFLSIIIAVWSVVNFASYQMHDEDMALLLVRLVMFFAAPFGALFYLLINNFPEERLIISTRHILFIGILTGITMAISLTPFLIESVVLSLDSAPEPKMGPGIISFLIVPVFAIVAGIIILIRKVRKSKGLEKIQSKFMLFGVALMFALILFFNFVLPTFFNNTNFIPFGAIFTFPFIILTTYAIVKHHLFNIRIIATEVMVVIIWIILFSKIFVYSSSSDLLVDIIVFVMTIPFGIMLIRSVIKEVRLAEQQYEMVATVSHQLRTPLTPVLGYAAMMDQGDFDGHPEELKDAQHRLLISTQRLRNIINDFLQMFELEGEHKMDSVKTPLQDIVNEAMAGVKENYEQKKLYLKLENPSNVNPILVGETKLLVQAINNLLDNAQRYTIEGGSTVQLSVEKNRAIIKVTDTGIGLDENDKQRLFTKFYRSDAAKEVRPDGSGLGLPIVKTVVEAHGGKVHAESEGRGKGTTFIIELPLKKQ